MGQTNQILIRMGTILLLTLLLAALGCTTKKAEQNLDVETMKVGSLGKVSGAHARIGRPDAEIVRLADEIGAGLIVIGSRGLGGVRRALIGSTSASVVRHAPFSSVTNEGRWVCSTGYAGFLPAA